MACAILLVSSAQDIHCKFQLYGDKEETSTASLPHSPQLDFNHRRIFHMESVTKEVELFGKSSVN